MDYIARERQRQAQPTQLQEEHLDWLHELHEEAKTQSLLLQAQTEILEEMRRHTRFVSNVVLWWFVLTLPGLMGWILFLLASR